ncbi:hypothetical protein NQ176_g5608 [Zarea fungicola]|uniref:Uncharacterized protein n=1 Tax=Zarea fungicola TaxID=93591 RepID=A0ACC1N9I5_9HYPO|nr:hypothetical protein NQ176_g5608 [Lecanicillium fungicola]
MCAYVFYPPPGQTSLYQTERDRTALLVAEMIFVCNTRYLAVAQGDNTWNYRFQVFPAAHAQDVDYTFWDSSPFHPIPYPALAQQMQRYFTRFAMTGNPNIAKSQNPLPEWPVYGDAGKINTFGPDGTGTAVDDARNSRRDPLPEWPLYGDAGKINTFGPDGTGTAVEDARNNSAAAMGRLMLQGVTVASHNGNPTHHPFYRMRTDAGRLGLGDIIQLCQLAIQLGRAVGIGGAAVNGNSCQEYQQLRDDLDLFVGVVATFQQHEFNPCIQVLDNVSKSVVQKCTTLIHDTLDHLQARYGSSLTKGGSGNKARDVIKRVEWCLREKDRIQALQNALREGVQRLALLSNLAARKSARVDNATLLARVDQVQQICQDSHHQLLRLLEEQRLKAADHFKEQNEKLCLVQNQISATEQTSRTLMCLAGDALKGILEVKDHVVSISQAVMRLQISASHSQCMRSLDPTRELSVILEDSLGRQIPIPSQWLDTLEWNALNALLTGYFQGKKGQDMVRRREYALEESASGRDVSVDIPLCQGLRRGMKINMSMVFLESKIIPGVCPGCKAVTDALQGVNIQCPVPGCGMWFRTQKLLIENKNLKSALPLLTNQSDEILSTKETTVVTSPPAEPGDFLRVRLLHVNEQRVLSDVEAEDTPDASFSGPIDKRLPGTGAGVLLTPKPRNVSSDSNSRYYSASYYKLGSSRSPSSYRSRTFKRNIHNPGEWNSFKYPSWGSDPSLASVPRYGNRDDL